MVRLFLQAERKSQFLREPVYGSSRPIRMSQLGVEVKKGAKNEITLQNPRVGELQFVGVEHEVFVEQEIEVNHPWTVFPDDLLAEARSVS